MILMRTLIKKIWSSEGIRSTGLVAIGNIISSGLGAIAMIMVFRLLSPTDFGIFSAIFAAMMVVVKIADFGTNIALQRILAQPSSHLSSSKKSSDWGLILIFKLLVGVLSILVAIFASDYLAPILHLNPIYLRLGLISVMGMIIYDHALITAQATHHFTLSVLANAAQSVIKILGIIALGYYTRVSAATLIILYGLAPFLGGLLVPLMLKLPLGKIDLADSRSRIIAITKWTSIAIISAAIADNLDVLMIQSMLDSSSTGLYSSAARIAGFVSLVGYAIGTVLNVRVAKYKTREHLERYLKKANLLAIASFSAMLLAIPLARLLIVLTAGLDYLAATQALQLLLVSTGLVLATSPYVALFYTLDRPQYFAISGVMIAVLLILGNWLLLPAYGIIGAGYAKLFTRLVVFVFTYLYAKKSYRSFIK